MVFPCSICSAAASGSVSPSQRIRMWHRRDAASATNSAAKNTRTRPPVLISPGYPLLWAKKRRMMEDVQLQLAALRRRVAQIDRKYAGEPPAARRPVRRPARHPIEELLTGEVVRTAHGAHFETERVWERHRRYGSVGISDLADLPADLLETLSAGAIPHAPPGKWAFLDTETTGLAAGACAFLIGVGSIDSAGFRLRQFFLRDYADEPSMLSRLSEYLG